jgi:hypothetical protein
MAQTELFFATGLTGGGDNNLDGIPSANLADGDAAIVTVKGTGVYFYTLNATSGVAESPPDVIAPNDAAGGTADYRWIMCSAYGSNIKFHDGILHADNGGTIDWINTGAGTQTTAGTDDNIVTEQYAKEVLDARGRYRLLYEEAPGWLQRPPFTYVSGTSITIGGGAWHVYDGSNDTIMYTDGDKTFVLESGGSNAGSTDLDGGSDVYIYIDVDGAGASGSLAASDFINTSTAPAWSHSKGGWYSGNNRCIFALIGNGVDSIYNFHNSANLVLWEDYNINIANNATPSNTWTSYDCISNLPLFDGRQYPLLMVEAVYVDTSTILYGRFGESSGTTGNIRLAQIRAGQTYNNATLPGPCWGPVVNTLSIKFSAACSNQVDIVNVGYYLPEGL